MTESRQDIPTIQKIIAVLWPSFLTSGLATILFFTAFDPEVLSLSGGYPQISRLGGYSIGFFLFWLLTSITCALTCYFQRPCENPRRRLETDTTAKVYVSTITAITCADIGSTKPYPISRIISHVVTLC